MKTNRKHTSMCVLMVMALALTSGCLFDTREADDPGGAGSTWQVPTVPSRVFLNLRTGLEELNGVNYEKSIHDDFIFRPLTGDENRFPQLVGWNADDEKAMLQRLLAESSALTVSFGSPDQDLDQSPLAGFNVEYTLTRMTNTIPPVEETFKAKAYFIMRDGSKGWQLIDWEDRELVDGDSETWGYLRGILSQ